MAGMFDFLGDFGSGATGQRAIPTRSQISPGDLYQGMAGSVGPLSSINRDWNNNRARNANEVEDIYNPLQRNLRGTTTKSILDELNLGGNLSQEDQDFVTKKALQGNVASGFGISPGGRGMVARDLGLRSLDLRNNRMDRARGFLAENPKGYQMYNEVTNPNDVADLMLGNSNATNDYNTFSSLLKSQNDKNESGSILNMAGSIFGAMGGMGGIFSNMGGGGAPSSVKAMPVDINGGGWDTMGGGGGGGGNFLSMFGGGGGGGRGGMGGGMGVMDYASIPGAVYTDANSIDQGNYGAGIGGLAGTAVGGYYGMPGLGQAVGSTAGGLLDSWFK